MRYFEYPEDEAAELALELSSRRISRQAKSDVFCWQGYIRKAIEEV